MNVLSLIRLLWARWHAWWTGDDFDDETNADYRKSTDDG